jgi:hypothetical protein
MRTDDRSVDSHGAEERRLSEMLHQVTPEPPRQVTVEDIAIRLANQSAAQRAATPRAARRGGARRPGPSGPGRGGARRFSPILAAAAVVVVVGGSTGIAISLTSRHSAPPAGGLSSSSAPGPAQPASTVPVSPASSQSGPTWQPTGEPSNPPTPISGGPWNAEQIANNALTPGSMTGAGDALYAIAQGYLVEFDARNGNLVGQAPYTAPIDNKPVLAGGAVWVVESYGTSSVTYEGFSDRRLAVRGHVKLPVTGSVAAQPQGIMAAGPDGNLYVAAGSSVDVVNPVTARLLRTISAPGPVSSIAVSPDGSRLWVGSSSSYSFRLTAYSTSSGAQLLTSSSGSGSGGNLIATSGGVWGTFGFAMSERVWYAPGGDLSQLRTVTQPGSGAQDAAPTMAGGLVWLGGTRQLACLNGSGSLLASAPIAADNGVPRHFGSLTAVNGHIYATYTDDRGHYAGIAILSPPAACTN